MAKVFKNAAREIAHLDGVGRLLDATAAEMLGRAKADAQRYRDTGAFSASLAVERGRVDRFVVAHDPAALEIELGHFATKKNGQLGRWVPGKHSLIRARDAMVVGNAT